MTSELTSGPITTKDAAAIFIKETSTVIDDHVEAFVKETATPAPGTATPVPNNGIILTNTLYESLQQKLDKTVSHTFKQLPNISVITNNTPKTKINTSGNIKIVVDVPLTDAQKPNYAETIMLGRAQMQNIPESVNILLNTLLEPSFTVANTPTTNLNANPAPAGYRGEIKYVANAPEDLRAMLNTNKSNPLYAWNLNYNRNLDINAVKRISAHVMNRFNTLIDYIITNDIKAPDNTFRQLVKDIFANGNNVYNFAHYTLMLPALVNYFAANGGNDKTCHATRYTGIVKKGSGLHPKRAANFASETKWHPGGDSITVSTVCPYAIVNGGRIKADVGGYNYPFTQTNYDRNRFKPTALDVNASNTDPVISKITFKFTSDEYKYVNPDGQTLAKVNGTHTRPGPEYGSRILDWNNGSDYSKETAYTGCAVGKGYVAGCSASPSWQYACGEDCAYKGFLIKKFKVNCKTRYCTGSCTNAMNAIPSQAFGSGNTPQSSRIWDKFVSSQWCSGSSCNSKGQYTEDVSCVGSPVILGTPIASTRLEFDTGRFCDNPNSVNCGGAYQTPNDSKSKYLTDRPAYNYKSGSSVINVTAADPRHIYANIPYKKNLYVQTIKHTYKGEFNNSTIVSGPADNECVRTLNRGNTPAKTELRQEIIWLYHTLMDINYFNNEVFADWLYLIQTPSALQKLLNDLRSLLTSNPELILLNKINNKWGTYVRSQNREAMCFMDQPFGAPLINLNESYVLPNKFYHPEFEVNKGIDTVNTNYNADYTHNNIINTIKPNTKSTKYAQYNYLDNTYQTMYTLCKSSNIFDNNMSMAITIPKRGCQLFEAASENQDSGSTQRINNSGALVRLLSTNDVTKDSIIDSGKTVLPRLIMKVGTPLSGAIAEAYDLISSAMEVHVPIINVKKNANSYNIIINTSSEDNDNKVLVYAAKPAKTLGNYSAKMNTYVNSMTKTQMNVVNISYDGNETRETPVLLMKRFK